MSTIRRYFVYFALGLLLFTSSMPAAIAETPSNANSQSQTYKNPILTEDWPADPDVVLVDGTYYLYPTTHGRGYDVWTSTDLINWKPRGSVYKSPRGGAWAPDLFHNKRGDNKFYLYYTDSAPNAPQHGPFGKQIGVAVSDSPLGPFEDKKVFATGAIDAHLFEDDDGRLFLYYVEIADGFKIFVQPLSNPLTMQGGRIELLHPTEKWEMASGNVTEGPFMLKRNGTYYLMYSGSGADSPNYAIGYATSNSPLGPFKKYAGNPIVHRSNDNAKSTGDGKPNDSDAKESDTPIYGPGHHCVVTGPDGKLWMLYHQKYDDSTNYRRFLALDPIWFDDQGVLHARTTRGTTEAAPVIGK